MAKVYQEEKSIFSSNGKSYDLNAIFKMVANQPLEQIAVNKLIWVLEFTGDDYDRQRVEDSDIKVPVLVTLHEGKELVIDGYHRLLKALKKHVKVLPYKRVTPEQMKQALSRNWET